MEKITTLDVVLRQANGAVILPLKRAAVLLGLEPGTCRNQMSKGTFSLPVLKMHGRVFVRAQDLADRIDSLVGQAETAPRRRGRKTKAELAAAAARGEA